MGEKSRNSLSWTLKWGFRALLICAVGALFYWFPPIRIVPLDMAKQREKSRQFQPKAYARSFWNDRLMKSLDRAHDAATLLAAARSDPREAKAKYAQTFGMGRAYYYFVRGTGRVVSADENSVALCLGADDETVDVSIPVGTIPRNVICKGTGLIEMSEFADTRDFNRVSEEVDKIVKTEVLPPFRKAMKLGSNVEFCGCVQVVDAQQDLHPMHIVPIALRLQSVPRDEP